jgi:long-chain acyl-CoA synthetase
MLQHFIEDGDTVMAYLPLAHVLEFLVENVCIFFGLTLGYGTVKTLTDASVRECRGDFAAFRPSIVTGVPQVWETIKKTVMATVAARGPRIESIFHGAVDLKSWLYDNGLPAGVLDKVVFRKVKQQLGGRFRYALSGGAPLSTDTQRFLSLTAAPILGGYGMTESCGMCSVMTPEQFSYGPVGAPVPCTEVKLVDAPEAGYLSTNEPKPQGEIWIRGPSVTAGYFKNEALTKESITADGWLMTGDIGEWNQNGTLSIIDRRKNLIKLSNGEYIALEKIESVYKSSTLAENVCVYADSLCARPVALFVPVEKSLKDICQEKGLGSEDWDTLCKDRAVRNLVLELLRDQGKKSGLKGSELIHDVWICPELWTTDMVCNILDSESWRNAQTNSIFLAGLSYCCTKT